MRAYIAILYVKVLFLSEFILFVLSLVLHSCAIARPERLDEHYEVILFQAVVLLGIVILPFVKDSLRWKDQIKTCPKWMWRSSLVLGLYGLLISCLEVLFSGRSFFDLHLSTTGFPLGFEAVGLCILYSVLHRNYLEKSELLKRSLISIGWVFFWTIVIIAHHVGYLQRPASSN
jgi:hypothetical protein